MNTDAELLRRYVHDRDEPAFTELVQRHLGLVYSVALRRVGGDKHLAEDVTQRVFSVLARKSATLLSRPTLSGWLYTSAHLTSAAVVRGERRRKVHETEAQLMQNMLSSSEADADWTRLRQVIDDVIVALKEEDREAIALRFFEKRSFADVGLALRVTEEAARKRVDRALEKLHGLLAQRGITSTTAALGVALPAFAADNSPAVLVSKITRHALTGGPPAPLLSGIAQTLWPAALALVAGGFVLVWKHQSNDALRAELAARVVANKNALAILRAENQQLVKSIEAVSARSSSSRSANTPVSEAGVARVRLPQTVQWGRVPAIPPGDAAGVSSGATITITPATTVAWNSRYITIQELRHRLVELQSSNPQAVIRIRSMSAINGKAVQYVVDEARRAKIQTISEETLDGWWF